jgi:hypothetical protein
VTENWKIFKKKNLKQTAYEGFQFLLFHLQFLNVILLKIYGIYQNQQMRPKKLSFFSIESKFSRLPRFCERFIKNSIKLEGENSKLASDLIKDSEQSIFRVKQQNSSPKRHRTVQSLSSITRPKANDVSILPRIRCLESSVHPPCLLEKQIYFSAIL